MKNFMTFKNATFGEIRTMMGENGEPLFVGKDVAEVLGYSNVSDALIKHVDGEDRIDRIANRDSIGRNRKVVFINESGLYSLIFSSKLPQARAFKRWVTSEVLPQIRMTGGYIPTHDAEGRELTDEELMERANSIMQRTIKMKNLPADGCLTASILAKCIGIDVKSLNEILSERGVIKWRGGRYQLTPRYQNQGYSKERFFIYRSLNGINRERRYMVWTPSGAEFVRDLLIKN